MRIVSVRQEPDYKQSAIKYFQESWPDIAPILYEDSISHCIHAEQFLPQWYLLLKDDTIIGCAGLITNDFISRMDLYPWICALFIDQQHRGNRYAELLVNKAKMDAKLGGFKYLNLCTDLDGYYERFGFNYIGQGYHPWDAESRIYQIKL